MDDTPDTLMTAALAKAQSKFPPVEKKGKAKAGSFSYEYADLADIQKAIVPILSEHDIAYSQPTMFQGGIFGVQTELRHVGGGKIIAFYPLPDPATTKPQDMGSHMTYGRRYSFVSATGAVLVGEDDDGTKAQASDATPKTVKPAAPPKTPVKIPDQYTEDGTSFFARPTLEIPVVETSDGFLWGKWVTCFKARLGQTATIKAQLELESHNATQLASLKEAKLEWAEKLDEEMAARRAFFAQAPLEETT